MGNDLFIQTNALSAFAYASNDDDDDDQDGESGIKMRAALLDTKKFVTT